MRVNLPKPALWMPLLLVTLLACKKSNHGVNPSGSANANDTMYFIFRDEYLWTDKVPDSATIKPSSYGSLNELFSKLVSFEPLDRYSFLDNGEVSGLLENGVSGDFGFQVNYNAVNDLRVLYCYEGSPAYQQGVRRSWQITAINGDSNISYDQDGFGDNSGRNVKKVNNAMNSSSAAFTFKKPDGSSVTLTIARAQYNVNPILYSKVFDVNGRKTGYFVFNQFVDISLIKSKIDALFKSTFSGITDLIVDLRYNGGGVVATQEYLANLIAPSSVGSKQTVMYREVYNNTITSKQYSNYMKGKKLPPPDNRYSYADVFNFLLDESTHYFSKEGSLNLQHVVFIGSRNTASASELLINNLSPVVSTTLVGDTTYGKPVGFIGITFGQQDMYAISFQSLNSQNKGDYFTGLPPKEGYQDYEDYAYDFGDSREVYLGLALKALGISSAELGLRTAPQSHIDLKLRSSMQKNAVNNTLFNGMIENRIKPY